MAASARAKPRRRAIPRPRPPTIPAPTSRPQSARSPRSLENPPPHLALLCVLFRWLNCFLIQTQFDPDEFWQALEPAHLLVHGRGHLTWEWAPGVELRTWLHPLVLAAPMHLAKLVNPQSAYLASMLPRVLVHGTLTGLADQATYRVARRLGGSGAAAWALLFSLSSWFQFYCSVRTYGNSLEANLLIIALSYFPLPGAPTRDLRLALAIASLGVCARSSSVLAWLVLGPMYLLDLRSLALAVQVLWRVVLPVALLALLFLFAVDSLGYGHASFSPWNFVRLNVLTDVSSLYGVHPWHWYLSQCLPAIVGSALPALMYSLWGRDRTPGERRLLWTSAFVLFALSLNPHKELRFALPMLALLHVCAGMGSWRLLRTRPSWRHCVCLGAINAVPALFLGLFHQRAPVDAAYFLSRLDSVTRVDLLLPCHAMPLYSHIHRDVEMYFPDCSPGLPELSDAALWDRKSSALVQDPAAFVRARYGVAAAASGPSHLVTASRFEASIRQAWPGPDLIELARFPWAQADLGDEIVVFKLRDGGAATVPHDHEEENR